MPHVATLRAITPFDWHHAPELADLWVATWTLAMPAIDFEARRLSPAAITLDVNLDNARAVAFYRREGFVQIGEGANPRSGLKTLKLRWDAAP